MLAAPQAVADRYGAVANTTLTVAAAGVLSNDTDADGDALTAEALSQPTNGTLVFFNPDGGFRYRPNTGFQGTDSFTYRNSDGTEFSDPVTVTLTVRDGTPLALDDLYNLNEDAVLTVDVDRGVLRNDTDITGQELTAVLANGPAHGVLTLNDDGSFVYTPDANYFGEDSFTYRASDGTVQSAPATVTLAIRSQPDAPVANDDFYLLPQTETVVTADVGVLANDFDPDDDPATPSIIEDPISARIVSQPSVGSVTLNANGSFVYDRPAEFIGTVTFSYSVSDSTPSTPDAIAEVTIRVAPEVIAEDDSYGPFSEDTMLTVSAAAGLLNNDSLPDFDGLIFPILVDAPLRGEVELNNDGSFTYKPDPNFNGVDTFTYRIRAGGVETIADEVELPYDLAVDPAGGKVYFTDAQSRTLRRANLNGTNEEILVSTGLSVPAGVGLDTAAGKVYWTDLGTNRIMRANFDGSGVETVIASGLIDPRDVAVSNGKVYWTDLGSQKIQRADLNGANREDVVVNVVAPTSLVASGDTLYWSDSVDGFIQTVDVPTPLDEPIDAPTILVDGLNGPQGVALDATNGFIYWAEEGVQQIRRASLDGMTIETVNDSGLVQPYGVAIDPASEHLYWSDFGTDSISRNLLGPLGESFESNLATVSLEITPVNDVPTAFNDVYSHNGFAQLNISAAEGVLANDSDVDGDPIQAQVVSSPTRGELFLAPNGSFVYRPFATFNGDDSFTYRINDGVSTSNLATVRITNRPILRMGDVVTTTQDGSVVGYFDVFVEKASVGAISVTGYEVQLNVAEADSGISFTHATATPNNTPLFAGTPTVIGVGESLQVTDFASTGTVSLVNGRGLFRAHFTVDPNVIGSFHVVFDQVFTSISDIAARPITLGGLDVGLIDIARQAAITPSVVEVLVSSEGEGGWTQEFKTELQTLGLGLDGYSIPVGATSQLLPVGWDSVNAVKLRFSTDVFIDQDDLQITGVNVEEYDILDFNYDSDTRTATWIVGSAFSVDKLLLSLNADGDDPVRSLGGRRLDGEWIDGVSLISGNGTPGGDFHFRLNMLPGDVDANNRTNISDTIQTRDRQFTQVGDLIYTVFHDMDGSGAINVLDTVRVANNQFGILPTPDPVPPVFTIVERSRKDSDDGLAEDVAAVAAGRSIDASAVGLAQAFDALFAAEEDDE